MRVPACAGRLYAHSCGCGGAGAGAGAMYDHDHDEETELVDGRSISGPAGPGHDAALASTCQPITFTMYQVSPNPQIIDV